MSDETPLAALTHEAAMQVVVIYLAAAKLDASGQQAKRLAMISGPADPAHVTVEETRRITAAVKGVMGSAWKLDAAWGKRLLAVIQAGISHQEGG